MLDRTILDVAPARGLLNDAVVLDVLMGACNSPCCVMDSGLRFVRYNQAFAAEGKARWQQEVRPGLAITDMMPASDHRTLLIDHLREALAGTPGSTTAWTDGPKKTRSLVETRFLPVRGTEGAVIGVLMTCHLVDHGPASRRPESSDLIAYLNMFEVAPVGMVITTHDGSILKANPSFCRMIGSTAEQLQATTIQALTHADDRGASPLNALVRGNIDHYQVTKRYLRANGGAIECSVAAVRLPGDPPQVLGVIEPIRQDASPPRPNEDWYRAMFDSQPQGRALLTGDGRVVLANGSLAAMVGLAPGAMDGRKLADFIILTDPAEQLQAALASAKNVPARLEAELRGPANVASPVEIVVFPVRIGEQLRLACTVRDRREAQGIEVARQVSEQRYQELVERAPTLTRTFSLIRGGLSYSPQVEEILGYTPAELVAQPQLWNESIHPEDRPGVLERIRRLRDAGGFDVEFRMRHKNGEWRWLREWSASIDRIGNETVVTAQALDVTPLREKERQFQRLVENVPDILYRWSARPEPHFSYLSEAVQTILGLTPAECLADPTIVERSFDASDWAEVMAFQTDPSLDRRAYRLRGQHKDGRPVVLEIRRTIIRGEDDSVIAVEGVARDVTSTVEAERRSALLSAGLEQAAEAVMITDARGSIIEVNAAFEQVTGYAREDTLGRNPSILKSGLQGDDFYTRMWQTLSAGQIFRGTLINRRRDGSNYIAETVITPIRDAEGETINYFGLQRDISRERLLNEALRQSQKMEAVGQVTGGIAHDFNNMLTVILANANLLEGTLPTGTEESEWLHELIASAQHGTGLVRQLLAYGRKEHLTPRPARLADEFGVFVPVLRRAVTESIDITYTGFDASWVSVDRTALEQMLLNLTTNARDAMPAGGRLTFRTASRRISESEAAVDPALPRPGQYSTISVTDTGKGMSPAVVDRIFEPFFTTKPVGKGTGLGMSMVYGLMQQHGGWVRVESAEGVGTTITLGFPVVPPPPTPTAEPNEPVSKGGCGRGELILIVEDEPGLRRVASRTLEREGYKVITAADGEAGWNQWQEHGDAVALILTDAIMPRLGGVQLIRRLEAGGCKVPVILMSGYAAEDLADPSLQHVPVIHKPWSGPALAQRIREVIDASVDGGAR